MRLIDADVLFTDEQFEKYMKKILIEDGTGDVYIRPEDVVDMIMEAPTIDAVKVVRCVDCGHFIPNREPIETEVNIYGECELTHSLAECFGYCDRSERKRDDK